MGRLCKWRARFRGRRCGLCTRWRGWGWGFASPCPASIPCLECHTGSTLSGDCRFIRGRFVAFGRALTCSIEGLFALGRFWQCSPGLCCWASLLAVARGLCCQAMHGLSWDQGLGILCPFLGAKARCAFGCLVLSRGCERLFCLGSPGIGPEAISLVSVPICTVGSG